MEPILYLLAGLLQDYLIAKYYLALTARRLVVAPALGALITVLTVVVFAQLTHPGSTLAILMYGLGTGLGTLLGLIRPRKINANTELG